MTILRHILVIYVVMHFSPSLYKTVDCSLVTKPQNVTALSGQVVTLNCSAQTRDSIIWEIIDPVSLKRERIYDKTHLTEIGASYNISVSTGDEKIRSLTFTASLKAAKRYKCLDINYGDEGSGTAELFFLESPTKCWRNWVLDESVNVSCSVVYSGNWAPELECKQTDASKIYINLQGNEPSKSTTINNGIISTWSFYSKNKSNEIIGSIKHVHADRRREIILFAAYTGSDWRDRAIHFLITIFVETKNEQSELYKFLQSKTFEIQVPNIKNSTHLHEAVLNWKMLKGQNRGHQSSESDWRERAIKCLTNIIEAETRKNATKIYTFLKYEKFDRSITNFAALVKAVDENNQDCPTCTCKISDSGLVVLWISVSFESLTLIVVIGVNGTVAYRVKKYRRFEIRGKVLVYQKSSEVEDKNKVELQKAKPDTERREGMDPASKKAKG